MEKNEKLDETLESLPEELYIGGNAFMRIFPDEFAEKEQRNYKITGIKNIVNTADYGVRFDYVITNGFEEFVISSWAIMCKEKYKPQDLVGKQVELTLLKKDSKKLLMEYVPM